MTPEQRARMRDDRFAECQRDDASPFTMQAKRKLVGNAVALPTGRALARAVAAWLEAAPLTAARAGR